LQFQALNTNPGAIENPRSFFDSVNTWYATYPEVHLLYFHEARPLKVRNKRFRIVHPLMQMKILQGRIDSVHDIPVWWNRWSKQESLVHTICIIRETVCPASGLSGR